MVRLFLSLLLSSTPSWAILYQDINIETMVSQADRILAGRVIAQETGVINDKPFVQTTFEVVKGYTAGLGQQVTIKQFGRVDSKHTIKTFPGLPTFQKGGVYLLFLENANAEGFASPVGLLTFELISKNTQAIVTGQGLIQARPTRPVKGLFDNIQNSEVNALVESRKQSNVKKSNVLELPFLEQIIQRKNQL
ncbi:MAG: hypothetical protein KDD46_05395 [Bdellovibrionales bacterium]|nr:hypothetical protein [Bdellovibrionales bacterium]